MAKTNKVVNVLSVAALAGMVLSTNAFAAVDSYSVKVGADVLEYNKVQLTESFLADKAGNADGAKLYKDFAKNLETAKGFYAFHDDKTNRYVDFNDVQSAFLADREKFNLETYVSQDTAKVPADLPKVIKVVSVDKGEIKTTDKNIDGTVVTGDLKVDSISAINGTTNNLKNFTIKFNKEVDVNTVTASTLKLYKNASTSTTPYTQRLSEDKMTLTVALNTNASQNDSLKIAVEGVKDLAGNAIVKYEGTAILVDTIIPQVSDVVPTSSKTLDVIFSEPMNVTETSKVWDEIYIDGFKAFATVTTGSMATQNKLTITLPNKLAAGEHTFKLDGFRDYAGFTVKKEGTFTVVADTKAPSIVSATVTKKNEIQVVFDEPITSSTIALNSANFTVTEAGGVAKQVTARANAAGDNKTFELTLSGDLTPAAIVNIDVVYKNVADLEGNANATAQTLKLKATDDLVQPTATAVVDNVNNSVELTFSEKMDTTLATTASNYSLYKDGVKVATTISVAAKTGDTTSTKFVATFSNSTALSGNYKLRMNNLKDASIRGNVIATDSEVAIALVDVDSPTIITTKATKAYKDTDSNSKIEALRIVLPYSEAMDATTALNLSNYVVAFGAGQDIVVSTISGAKAEFGADNKTVVITLPGTEIDGTTVKIGNVTVTHGTDEVKVKVLAVKDVAGNVLSSSNINAAITLNTFASDSATLTTVKAIASNKVEIKSEIPFSAIDPNGIRFVGATTTTDVAQQVYATSVSFSSDMKTATLTLSTNIIANGTFDLDETAGTTLENLKLAVYTDTAIVNNLGQNVKKGTLSDANTFVINAGTTYAVADVIAPSIASVDPIIKGAAVDQIRVTFDENLALAAADSAKLAGIANDLVVTIAGTQLDVAKGEFIVIADTDNDATFAIQIKKDGITATEDVQVKLNSGRYILDTAGNAGNGFDTKTIKTANLINELVAPTAVLSGTTATTIVATFSEGLYINGAIVANGQDVKASFTKAGDVTITSAIYDTTNKTVTFTVAAAADTNTITHNADATKLTDAAGNAYAADVYTYTAATTTWAK